MNEKIQPKKGRWKKNGYCSECGAKAPYWEWSLFWHESNFCPNCGAKMDKSNEKTQSTA